jgi:N-acyl-D-amino-acid deacylase
MSTGLIYTPGRYIRPEEIIELQGVVGEFGGIYASHMRSEGSKIMEAIDEALRVGRETGTRVEISHFKLPADVATRIGGSDATLKKVVDARAGGQEVWVDQYPYTASSTSLSQMLPNWIAEGGRDEAKKILRDPVQVAKILKDMTDDHERGRQRKDLSYAVVSSCKEHRDYEGKNIKQITQINKLKAQGGAKVELLSDASKAELPAVSMEEQYRTVIDIQLSGGASCVFHTMNESEVENILRSPLVSVASDSGVRDFGVGVPHPRGYGTNSRVLGRYVREKKTISLEEAVRKMTSMPAAAFRLKDRGMLRAGAWADVTIFDPEKVIDNATFEKPHQYPKGIEYVIVNGELVVENGKVTGKLPGRAVRRNPRD